MQVSGLLEYFTDLTTDSDWDPCEALVDEQ